MKSNSIFAKTALVLILSLTGLNSFALTQEDADAKLPAARKLAKDFSEKVIAPILAPAKFHNCSVTQQLDKNGGLIVTIKLDGSGEERSLKFRPISSNGLLNTSDSTSPNQIYSLISLAYQIETNTSWQGGEGTLTLGLYPVIGGPLGATRVEVKIVGDPHVSAGSLYCLGDIPPL